MNLGLRPSPLLLRPIAVFIGRAFLLPVAFFAPTSSYLHAQSHEQQHTPAPSLYSLGHYVGKIEAILQQDDGNATFAVLDENSTLRVGDAFFTGTLSLAQLHGPDSLSVRLGAEVAGELQGPRALLLSAGTILVCLPEETRFAIRSTVAAASYEGKGTFIVECTGNGGFKIIHLEGKGSYFTQKGGALKLKGGQLAFVIREPSEFGDVYDIDLLLLIRTSRLLNAFPELPPTIGRIGLSFYSQELLMKGKYNALIGDAPTDKNVQLWTFEKGEGKSDPIDTPEKDNKPSFFRRFFGGEKKK